MAQPFPGRAFRARLYACSRAAGRSSSPAVTVVTAVPWLRDGPCRFPPCVHKRVNAIAQRDRLALFYKYDRNHNDLNKNGWNQNARAARSLRAGMPFPGNRDCHQTASRLSLRLARTCCREGISPASCRVPRQEQTIGFDPNRARILRRRCHPSSIARAY